MTGNAGEGFGSVVLEFDAGFDADQALLDVREKTDAAEAELPDSVKPKVNEINVALFPVLTLVLSGPIPERSLLNLAKRLQDEVEGLPGVLEVDLGGDREELLEVIVDAQVLESYQVTFDQVFAFVQQNNSLIAPGALDTGAGRMVLKVPGVLENIDDILNLPVKVEDGRVVTFSDVAQVRRTFKDPAALLAWTGRAHWRWKSKSAAAPT